MTGQSSAPHGPSRLPPSASRVPASVKIAPAKVLQGELEVPGDKSISHRAALFNALASGTARLKAFSPGDDCLSTLRCLRQLGVEIRQEAESCLEIDGLGLHGFHEPDDVLDCGNSGTTMRLLAGALAGQPFLSVLSGDSSLRSRPMARVAEPLRLMGAEVWGREGGRLAPLAIHGGPLRAIDYRTPVASAQVKSSILLAGLFAEGTTRVTEPASTRDHSERMLQAMGATLTRQGTTVSLTTPSCELRPVSLRVPGDLSSAAFWITLACLHPQARILVRSVGVNPGRTGFLDTLRAMGARLRLENERLEGAEPVADLLAESSELRAVEISGDQVPAQIDELVLVAVAACFARGQTRVRDAAELRHKESDRIAAMASELAKLGGRIDAHEDGWTIHGPSRLSGAECDSHGDHRVGMALAVAGMASHGAVLTDPECVSISYPGFWDQARRLGAVVANRLATNG